MATLKITVKYTLDGVTRRFTIKGETIDELYNALSEQISPEGVQAFWIDDEGDSVIIGCGADLEEAISHTEKNILRVILKEVLEKKNRSASAQTEVAKDAPAWAAVQQRPLTADNRPEGVAHSASCDLCDMMIIGTRFRCLMCVDYDLCQVCESTGAHATHAMMRIVDPNITHIPWGAKICQEAHRFGQTLSDNVNATKPRADDKLKEITKSGLMFLSEVGSAVTDALSNLGIDATYEVRGNKAPEKAEEAKEEKPIEKEEKPVYTEKIEVVDAEKSVSVTKEEKKAEVPAQAKTKFEIKARDTLLCPKKLEKMTRSKSTEQKGFSKYLDGFASLKAKDEVTKQKREKDEKVRKMLSDLQIKGQKYAEKKKNATAKFCESFTKRREGVNCRTSTFGMTEGMDRWNGDKRRKDRSFWHSDSEDEIINSIHDLSDEDFKKNFEDKKRKHGYNYHKDFVNDFSIQRTDKYPTKFGNDKFVRDHPQGFGDKSEFEGRNSGLTFERYGSFQQRAPYNFNSFAFASPYFDFPSKEGENEYERLKRLDAEYFKSLNSAQTKEDNSFNTPAFIENEWIAEDLQLGNRNDGFARAYEESKKKFAFGDETPTGDPTLGFGTGFARREGFDRPRVDETPEGFPTEFKSEGIEPVKEEIPTTKSGHFENDVPVLKHCRDCNRLILDECFGCSRPRANEFNRHSDNTSPQLLGFGTFSSDIDQNIETSGLTFSETGILFPVVATESVDMNVAVQPAKSETVKAAKEEIDGNIVEAKPISCDQESIGSEIITVDDVDSDGWVDAHEANQTEEINSVHAAATVSLVYPLLPSDELPSNQINVDETFSLLVQMGYTDQQARRAISHCGCDLENCIDYISQQY